MANASELRFLVLHALRIRGFAKSDMVAELAGLDTADVEGELVGLKNEGFVLFREARALWQLSPDGREAHRTVLEADAVRNGLRVALHVGYPAFLTLNESFKALCGDWQLRKGEPNDHADTTYDRNVIERLLALDATAQPICKQFAKAAKRFGPYGPRLSTAARHVDDGQKNLFTGVMCGSYHDVWMELHEDLILTLGIDRVAEGSF